MIIVDIEATGADVERCSILSIGAVDFNNPKNEFYGECGVRKGAKIDKQGLKVSGFTLKQIKENPKSVKKLLEEFSDWAGKIKDKTIAGQNVWWDRDILRVNYDLYKLKWIFSDSRGIPKVVDLHSLAHAVHLQKGIKVPIKGNIDGLGLNTILEFVGMKKLGVKRRNGPSHHALDDTKLEAEAFSRMIYGKGMFKVYKEYPVPKYLKS